MLVALRDHFLEPVNVEVDVLVALPRAEVVAARSEIGYAHAQHESTTGADVAAAHAALRTGGDVSSLHTVGRPGADISEVCGQAVKRARVPLLLRLVLAPEARVLLLLRLVLAPEARVLLLLRLVLAPEARVLLLLRLVLPPEARQRRVLPAKLTVVLLHPLRERLVVLAVLREHLFQSRARAALARDELHEMVEALEPVRADEVLLGDGREHAQVHARVVDLALERGPKRATVRSEVLLYPLPDAAAEPADLLRVPERVERDDAEAMHQLDGFGRDAVVERRTRVVARGEDADVDDDRGSREDAPAYVVVEYVPNWRPVEGEQEGGSTSFVTHEHERGSTSARGVDEREERW
ncbi:uncharacterized protein MICPUCDRAFT_69448 [Micromonas pusilla CCMP1545]|uniref:Predicted protein n=1 Tax=Micromonas pusilla (strain CCMP1545) TaxID=564608 RepID=C1MU33_MICPC|nr:uncharacterized protein MICPUCDRAFT_69448 [Micromonas pusilla CCMP1545]EEH56559.1 predicted protein [Micromonas pusilla CCMP1545]|eukprot:XP_003059427.1 predicted protein [Micromonas pusilla CCMP1545]